MTDPKNPLRGLLVASFLGAFNDNAWKLFVTLLAIRALPAGGDLEKGSQGIATLALCVFTIPLALLSVPAGLWADRIGKSRLVVLCKVLELALMVIGTLGLLVWPAGSVLDYLVLAGMGAMSALFGPAKLGLVPELVRHDKLSSANAALEGSAFLAIVLGTAIGGLLLELGGARPAVGGAVLCVLAALGLWGASCVPATPAARADARLRETVVGGWRAMRAERQLWFAVLGLVLFWAVASLLGQALLVHGKAVLGLPDRYAGAPMALFGIGVGAGAFLVGRLSRGKVEVGFVPLGALVLAAATFLLAVLAPGITVTCLLATLLGIASGFLIVPLDAILQWKAPPERRGAVIALTNALVFAGVLAGSLGAGALAGIGASTRTVFVAGGVVVLLGTAWALWLLPAAFVRLCLVLLTHTLYRVRVHGRANLPEVGGALLTPNHVTFVDGLWLLASLDRPVRFLVEKSYYEKPLLRPFLKALGAIPIQAGSGPRVVLRALREAGELLERGEIVCIFPEGQLTRTGQLQAFRRGFERIAKGRSAPIVPVHLDRAWGSIFSRAAGRFLTKIPERVPYPIDVHFGPPLAPDADVDVVRQAIVRLSCEAALQRAGENEPLHRAFVRRARRRPFALAVADGVEGRELSRSKALAGAIGIARALRPQWGADERIGVLLPPSCAGALVNVALSLAGKTGVNLNFTTGAAGLGSALRQAQVRHVVTAREFLAKAKVELPQTVTPIWIEDMLPTLPKLSSLLLAMLAPVRLVERVCGGGRRTANDVATVIFSSGSTGEPKGVELTHGNVASNVAGIAQIMPIGAHDRLLAILPLFHSFGFLSLWVGLQRGVGLVCHPNPLDAPAVGELVERYAVTLLLATPTFLQIYARRCTPENFGSLRVVLTGAEKLPQRLVDAFAARFGIRPVEGYGASECAPVIAASTLDFRAPGFFQPGSRAGSVGRPLPGVAVRIVDPDTRVDLAVGQAGLLLVRGPNVMKGYLGRSDLTEKAMHDGWYVTGDLARLDEDGFLFVTDRLSRFSKIGGEMVPHGRVEEALHEAAEVAMPSFAVAGVPDEKKGERLVVLHTLDDCQVDAALAKLATMGLPNLFIPRRENCIKVAALPLLGTGKLDLRRVKQLALENGA